MEKEEALLIKVYSKRNDDGTESVVTIYKDKDGNKKSYLTPRALAPYYIIKDKTTDEAKHQPMFIEKDKVEKKIVYKDSLLDSIAIDTGMRNYLDKCRIEHNSYRANNLFRHPWIYNADMDTCDYYMSLFNSEHEQSKDVKLNKGYFDIEVDIINHTGFPDQEIAPVPINIISYFDEPTMSVYSFILRNSKNPQIKEFEDTQKVFKEYLYNKFLKEDDVDIKEFDFQFFDDELSLVINFLDTIHSFDPDYILAWNMTFDVKTMINRLKKLYSKKYNKYESYLKTLEAFCDDKYLNYDVDGKEHSLKGNMYYKDNPRIKPEDRVDYFDVSDGINWIDAMYTYATIRKGQTKKESYSLDYTLSEELGKNKLDLGAGCTIKNIPYKNFKRFVEYNIRDILLMYLLERKNLDINMLHTLSHITNTRINKVMKKSISIKNFVDTFAKEQNLIMRNNININYGDDTEFNDLIDFSDRDEFLTDVDKLFKDAYEHKDTIGAYVGDPLLNAQNGKEIFKGKKSMYIHENVADEDLKSLYPSIYISFNLDSATEIGRFFFISKDVRNKLDDEYDYTDLSSASSEAEKFDDVTTFFVDSLISQDWNNIGIKYFELPGTEELINELLEK